MFKRILIANRGEIALRIIRTCQEMDIETLAIYSPADKSQLHVELADRAVCIGGNKASDSYLNIPSIIETALKFECDAIHPGFGFLSENSEFAKACEDNGITFIGPSAKVIDQMGNKNSARELMIKNGIPVVPGSDGFIKSLDEALKTADEIGYPVLVKASFGGGGRGLRRANDEKELKEAFLTAKKEAESCFGNDEVYIEKLILNPKHIEFQLLGDKHLNIVHLGDRECSVQRKNQKLIEEAPSKTLTKELREKMGEAAIKAGKACGYYSAGTVEFVLDSNNNFYFIEMNTRIQVEHPITEMITGIDIVKEQIRIAAGLKLGFTQEDIKLTGHAIECRINAEDPRNDFRPSPGKIDFMHFPGGNGIRIDSALYTGGEISPFYDSMTAKIIAYAPTRLEALRKMRRAIEETIIDGVTTNIELIHLILYHPEFIKGTYTVSFIENHLDEILNWGNNG